MSRRELDALRRMIAATAQRARAAHLEPDDGGNDDDIDGLEEFRDGTTGGRTDDTSNA